MSELIAPVITLSGIGIAGMFAYVNIRTARRLSRIKATLDQIQHENWTERYRDLTNNFSDFRKSNNFTAIVQPVDADMKERRKVIDYLNHYELIAIGIQMNVLDGKLYKLWMCSSFVRDWNAASSWIQTVRMSSGTYDPAPYKTIEWLARRWAPREAIVLHPILPLRASEVNGTAQALPMSEN